MDEETKPGSRKSDQRSLPGLKHSFQFRQHGEETAGICLPLGSFTKLTPSCLCRHGGTK